MTSEHDRLLTERVADHFPGAAVTPEGIELGFGGLRMKCWVDKVSQVGDYAAASLFFNLSGGAIGDAPVFLSVSGYERTEENAVILGACNWACSFGPVLRAGLGGEDVLDLDRFEASLDGQTFRVFIDGLDRAMFFGDGVEDASARLQATRARFGAAPWLARIVMESGRLPLLAADTPTVLSVFVSDAPTRRVVEIKINGVDWPVQIPRLLEAGEEPPGAVTLLRELAVLVPQGDARALLRSAIERTLAGVAIVTEAGARRTTSWPGWAAHEGRLGAPLAAVDIERLEGQVGPLPADYRAFLRDVAASGAGPGYGLLSPMADAQTRFARGELAWQHEGEAAASPAGVLPLAHAGCGVFWLLVLRGPAKGEVWVDAAGSDGRARRVAGSFLEWYRGWLTAIVRDAAPWCQWDARCCATPNVLSQVLENLENEGYRGDAARTRLLELELKISIRNQGERYFADQTLLDPCQSCVMLMQGFELGDAVFRRSEDPPAPVAPPSGLWGRLGRLFRG